MALAMLLLWPAAGLAQFELSLTPNTATTKTTTQPVVFWQAATVPAAPATRPARELKKLVEELGSWDSDVRDDARRKLMGVTRSDLETLQAVVRAGPKLTTAQTSLLRDVVIHVFLSTEPYAKTRQALLGVRDLAAVKVGPERAEGDDAKDDDERAGAGVEGAGALGGGKGGIIIEGNGAGGVFIFADPGQRSSADIGGVVSERMAGFCACRRLDNGDVVLAVKGEREFRPRTVWDFQVVIRSHEPGDTITLQVLRRGKLVDVTLTLDAFPECATDPRTSQRELEEFRRTRDEAAESFWQKSFGALVGDGVS